VGGVLAACTPVGAGHPPVPVRERLATRLHGVSLLEDVQVVPFEAAAARADGPLQAQHRERNRHALDELTAAHAIARQVVLVNDKASDFLAFPVLVVENWVKAH